jgi:uncharacterized membrane protein YkoI
MSFFGAALEPRLKGLFICGSGSPDHNGPVNPRCPALSRAARAARHPPLARHTVLAGLVGAALGAALSLASGLAWSSDEPDHERARAAVAAGSVLPLATVLAKLQQSHPGQVLDLELEKEEGRWVYEIKLLQANGQLVKLEMDAATGELIRIKRRPGPSPHRRDEPHPNTAE